MIKEKKNRVNIYFIIHCLVLLRHNEIVKHLMVLLLYNSIDNENDIQKCNSQPKYPTQFQKMSNEFEVALRVAHHQRILNLAINIRDSMMVSISADGEGSETPQMPISTSYPVSTFSEISQVI